MLERQPDRTLQPGDVAPNVVLDAITRQGKVAVDDYRGRKPVSSASFAACIVPTAAARSPRWRSSTGAAREGHRHPDCGATRRSSARASISVIARCPICWPLPTPNVMSHRAFGLPNLEFTQDESDWPRKVGMSR